MKLDEHFWSSHQLLLGLIKQYLELHIQLKIKLKKFKNIFFIILNVALSDSGKIQENKILLKIHVGIEKDQF